MRITHAHFKPADSKEHLRPISDRFAFTAAPGLGHQRVAGQGRIDDFTCGFGTGDGEAGWIEQTELNQHRRLIPIDVFVREFAIAELDDRNQRNIDRATGWRNAWQHPVDRGRVGEAEDHLIDNPIMSDRPADRYHAGIGRIAADEMVFVKAFELVMSDSTHRHRIVVDGGVQPQRCYLPKAMETSCPSVTLFQPLKMPR